MRSIELGLGTAVIIKLVTSPEVFLLFRSGDGHEMFRGNTVFGSV